MGDPQVEMNSIELNRVEMVIKMTKGESHLNSDDDDDDDDTGATGSCSGIPERAAKHPIGVGHQRRQMAK